MDTITHGIVGAALGAAAPKLFYKTFSEKFFAPAKQIILAFVVGAIFPDSDIVIAAYSREMYLFEHRGYTHSLVFLPLWVFLLSLPFYYFRKKDFNKSIPIILTLGILSHIYMDAITSWGIMVYYPFSRYRLAWDQMFIIDLNYTVTMLVLLVLGLRNYKLKGSLWLKLSVCFFLFYHLLTTVNHFGAKRALKQIFEAQNIPINEMQVYPDVLNPFSWVGVAEKDNSYFVAYENLLTNSDEPLVAIEHLKNDPLAKIASSQPWASRLLKLTRHPAYRIEKQEGLEKIYLYDAQFTIRRNRILRRARDKMPMSLEQIYKDGKLVSEKLL